MRRRQTSHKISFSLLLTLFDVCHSESFTNKTILTKMCKTLCSNRDKNCALFESPVAVCYNGQSLFPNDPSWGEYDIWDIVVDSTSFIRTFYFSVNASCQNSADTFTLPFDECVGPFGQPFPWGIFSLVQPYNVMYLRNHDSTFFG
jgi:hypothetical protein